MEKNSGWQAKLALALVALGALIYALHFLLFRDARHIFTHFIGDLAFVFFEVLLVTLVIHRLLAHRRRRALLDKINMLVGAFFSEVGTDLLRQVAKLDSRAHRIGETLPAPDDWSESEFLNIGETIRRHDPEMETGEADLADLSEILRNSKPFLLDLLQNPTLVEDEPFADLVWAAYHLGKELEHRGDLSDLPATDRRHLNEDIERVYKLLIVQWMDYMRHLRSNHPHLFSRAARTMPFRHESSVEVR